MSLIKAIIKSFKYTKYRWASVGFKDGSILVGPVTEARWKELTEMRGSNLSGRK